MRVIMMGVIIMCAIVLIFNNHGKINHKPTRESGTVMNILNHKS